MRSCFCFLVTSFRFNPKSTGEGAATFVSVIYVIGHAGGLSKLFHNCVIYVH